MFAISSFYNTSEMGLRLFFIALWNSNYALSLRKMIAFVVPSIGYAIWFLFCCTYWPTMVPQCYEPYPSFGLIVFTGINCLTLPAGVVCLIVLAFMGLCCPCISYKLSEWVCEQRKKNIETNLLLKTLLKLPYDR